MSSKKLVLLPPLRVAKRDRGVNVRFTQDEFDWLNQIAEYRATTVTELVYYVTQAVLPELQNEMDEEKKKMKGEDSSPGQPAASLSSQPGTTDQISSTVPAVASADRKPSPSDMSHTNRLQARSADMFSVKDDKE